MPRAKRQPAIPKPSAELQAQHSLVDPDEQRHHKLQRTRSKSLMDLDPMEREFCILVAQGNSHEDAAAKANYPDPLAAAKTLIRRTTIQRALRTLYEKNMEISEVTREELIHGMRDAIAIARQMSDPRTMIAGYRELGLMHGMYAPTKVQITDDANIVRHLEGKSDAELVATITKNNQILSQKDMDEAEDATYA